MNHKEKIDKMMEELLPKNINRKIIFPFTHRLLLKYNINVPPPLFSSFIFNFLFCFFYASLMSFVFMFLYLFFLYNVIPLKVAINIAIKSAIFFGVFWSFFMSLYFLYLRKKYNFPLWKNYK